MSKVIDVNGHIIPLELSEEPTIVEDRSLNGGRQVILKFKNGFGASIIEHFYSYGLEMAVLDSNGNITYDTPITDDVLGHLSEFDVIEHLQEVIELEAK